MAMGEVCHVNNNEAVLSCDLQGKEESHGQRESHEITDRPDDENSDDTLPPEDFICPITQEIFRDPVQDLFGHTYERSAILAWLSAKGTCPMTRKAMRASDLIPNVLMKTKVRLWKREHHYQESDRMVEQQDKSIFYHLYDADGSDDGYRNDQDGEDGTDNVLFGYFSVALPESHTEERTSSRRRGRWSRSRRSAATSNNRTNEDDTPQFFVGMQDDEETYDGNGRDPRIDRLLEEYEHIIEEEDDRARELRRRRRRREARDRQQQQRAQNDHAAGAEQPSQSRRHRRRHSAPTAAALVQSQTISNAGDETVATTNTVSTISARRARAPGSALRKLLTLRRARNLEMVQ